MPGNVFIAAAAASGLPNDSVVNVTALVIGPEFLYGTSTGTA